MHTITPREYEVARLIVADLSNKEIAQQLRTTEQSVKNYVLDLIRKLGVRSRTGVAVALCTKDVQVVDRRGQYDGPRGPYRKRAA